MSTEPLICSMGLEGCDGMSPHHRPAPEQARDTGGLREALEYALNQWQMYADAERGPGPETRDNSEPGADYLTWLADGTDAEAQQYARCRAALSQGAAHEERGLDVARLTKAMYARLPYGNWTQDITAIDRVAAEYARLATPEAAPEEGTP